MPLDGSNRERRASPESTTIRTPSIVSEVSAMLVASTTLRRPGAAGRSAASCASGASSPNSGSTSVPAGSSPSLSARATRRISAAPGRNTSASPGCSASARRTVLATSRSSCSGCRLAWRTSTGNERSLLMIRGASPSSAATAAPSSVADITSSLRSWRRFRCTSRLSASPRSAARLRSWNSSKITSPVPSSAGSSCSRRPRMPSVTTSMRVSRLTLVSSRMRYPTRRPTGSPSVAAIRTATARAASRRGSSITMRRPASHGASSRASGTTVLLPAPGGASSTAAGRRASAARSSSSTAPMGSAGSGMLVIAAGASAGEA
jgi:hypothetical protein